jgi:hypothetical protein
MTIAPDRIFYPLEVRRPVDSSSHTARMKEIGAIGLELSQMLHLRPEPVP